MQALNKYLLKWITEYFLCVYIAIYSNKLSEIQLTDSTAESLEEGDGL